MKKPILVRKYFDKSPELNNVFNFSFVDLSDFRNGYNFLDPVEGAVYCIGIFTKDIHISMSVYLLHNDCSAGCTLNFLDNLSARPYQCADHLFRYCEHNYPWGMRFKFRTRFCDHLCQ